MKYFIIITLIAILAWVSCSSPIDVPANREVTETGSGGTSNDDIALNRTGLDYELVSYELTKPLDIEIINLTKKQLIIDSLSFSQHPELFSPLNGSLPVTLAPQGSPGFRQPVFINFTAKELGVFKDTMFIGGYDKPFLLLRASVPSVEVGDVDFSNQSVNTTKSKPIYIRNNTNQTVNVKSYKIVSSENVFVFRSQLPKEIPAQSTLQLIIQFGPKEIKPYQASIEFNIEASGIIDNIGLLNGQGMY